MEIRLAVEGDAAEIAAIYGPIVRETIISFEVEPPSSVEMHGRIVETLRDFPWLVCEDESRVLGYAYAGKHRTRAAYQWSVDVSAYVHTEARRLGVGRALYRSLLAILKLQGYYNAYAGIALPNPASVGLHEAVGFKPIGVYHAVGYKLGAWHDVGWWELWLQPHAPRPTPPLPLASVRHSAGWAAAVAGGLSSLRVRPAAAGPDAAADSPPAPTAANPE